MKWITGLLMAGLASAQHSVLFDTELVKVILAAEKPGPKGRLHKHDVNRVMIYLDEGQQELDYQASGVKKISFQPGTMRWDPAGGMHTSQTTGTKNYRLVEVEVKKPKGGPVSWPQADPVRVDGAHYKVELENDQVRVIRAKFPPGYQTPVHEHVLPRVVVYLTDYEMRVTAASGAVANPKGKAGEVAMPGPAKHAEVNVSGKPFEVLVVELK